MKFSTLFSFIVIAASTKCDNDEPNDASIRDIPTESSWKFRPYSEPKDFGFSFNLISDMFNELSDFNERL